MGKAGEERGKKWEKEIRESAETRLKIKNRRTGKSHVSLLLFSPFWQGRRRRGSLFHLPALFRSVSLSLSLEMFSAEFSRRGSLAESSARRRLVPPRSRKKVAVNRAYDDSRRDREFPSSGELEEQVASEINANQTYRHHRPRRRFRRYSRQNPGQETRRRPIANISE